MNLRNITIAKWACPLLIYLIGLALIAPYAFGTDYINVSDSAREYIIYSLIIEEGYSAIVDIANNPPGALTLQSTCLSVTLFPAILQRFIGVDPLLFFKLYTCFLIAFLPVIVYFIARRFTSQFYACLAAVFFMGQVGYLHAPSITRSNIALAFFALVVLVIFLPSLNRWMKGAGLAILAAMIVISHYGTTFVTLLLLIPTLGVIGLWQLARGRRFLYARYLLTFSIALLVGTLVWHVALTQSPWDAAVGLVTRSADPGDIIVVEIDGVVHEYGIFDIESRDEITQAAFGIRTPDGLREFNFNWTLFAVNWLAVVLMSAGLLMATIQWRSGKPIPLEYLVLSVMGFALIVVVIILPFASRGYGIERTYCQMATFLSIYFVIVCTAAAERLKLKSYMLMLPILLLYLGQNFSTTLSAIV